jgi:hypothetical protein
VADDLPEYRAWLLKQPCACAPCVAAVVVHHHTSAPTHAPGEAAPKDLSAKRGKSQRASDYYGIPLCHRHHGVELRAWQDQHVRRLHSLHGFLDELAPGALAPEDSAAPDVPPLADHAERRAIAGWLRRCAGARHLTADAAAALHDCADVLEKRVEPMAGEVF